jgi:hypothetical protein
MRGVSSPPHPRPRRDRRLASGLAAAALVLLPAAPALAHGEGDSAESRVLVIEALSYLANRPEGFEDMVSDKIGDALDAEDQEGVTISDVASAQEAFEAGDLTGARDLLQRSVQPLAGPVTGEETGTTVMLDPVDPSVDLTGLDGLLAALSGAAVAGGVVLAVRSRPRESIRDLNQTLTGGRP